MLYSLVIEKIRATLPGIIILQLSSHPDPISGSTTFVCPYQWMSYLNIIRSTYLSKRT